MVRLSQPGSRIAADAYGCRVLEVVHTAFCIQLCYAYVITGFGDFLGFGDINWYVFNLLRNAPSLTLRSITGVSV